MKKKICLVLAMLMLFLFVGCSETDKMEIGKVEQSVFEINTDYCTLKYPEKWKNSVTIEVAGPAISFIHTETKTKVFDIVFGEGEGYLLGVINGKDAKIEVRILEYGLESSNTQIDTFNAMMDDVNVILNHLSRDDDFELAS